MKRQSIAAAVIGLALLGMAACGKSGTKTSAGATPTTASGATPTTSAAGASGGATVKTANAGALGTILVDAQGMTLYRMTKENGNIVCTGGCTAIWPPLLVTSGSPTPGAGVDALATITRPDGGTQVTYHGMPLYHYAHDAKAGDTNGQGVGGIWFVVSPRGTSAPTTTTPTTAASSGSGSTYGGY